MIRRNKTTRKYHAPCSKVTQVWFEQNFCETGRMNVMLDELQNMNALTDEEGDPVEVFDLEF